MSLRWRIALALAVLGAVVAAVAALGAFLMTQDQLSSALDESVSTRAREVGNGPDGPDGRADGSIDQIDCPPDAVLRPAAAAQIVRPDGSIAVCLPDGPLLPAPATEPTGDQVLLDTVEVEGSSFRVATHLFHEGGVLQVARAEAEITDVLDLLKVRLGLLTLAVAVGAGLVGWLVSGRLVRPILHLRDTARRIAASQDLSTPVTIEGSGELRDLAASFTTMVDALASSRAQQQRLITDASHEMRTPLTSLTTNLELLERFEELPVEDRPQVLGAVRTDVDELTHLMTELVELATDRSSDEPVVDVDLADLAAAVIARTRRRSGRTIELLVDGDGTVPARPHMTERAIANLVDNAVKYSPASTPIEVHVGPSCVEVRDHGAGIAPDEQARVFERFYRADSARSVSGSGLGLAIVNQIVERHRGTVWARNGPDGGAWVGFTLNDHRPSTERQDA
jgi:two-component system, OmpR family, sensor histidine kinase MprB